MNGKMSLENNGANILPFPSIGTRTCTQFLVQIPAEIPAQMQRAPLTLSKPTLLVLPSIAAHSGNEENIAEHFADITAALDPDITDDLVIAAPQYPGFSELLTMITETQRTPHHHVAPFAQKLFDQLILPHLTPIPMRHESGKIIGTRHPADQFQTSLEGLSRLTIFGYSAGSAMAQNLSNAMNQSMDELGYTQDEKYNALKTISRFTSADVTRQPKAPKDYLEFNGLRFKGLHDRARPLVSALAHLRKGLLKGEFLPASAADHFHDIEITTRQWLKSAWDNLSTTPDNPDHAIYANICRSQYLAVLIAKIIPTNHALDLFLSNDYLTNHLNAALRRSIAGDKKPDPPKPSGPNDKPPATAPPEELVA